MTTYTNIQSTYSPDTYSEGVLMQPKSSLKADRMQKTILSSLNSRLIQTSALLRMVVMVVMMIGWSSAWAFTDFTIDLTQNPVGDLPSGVTKISYPSNGAGFNGAQHGWQWYAIEFAVDGPVKITLGGCQYINSTDNEGYVKVKNGDKLADIHNKTAACYDADPANNVGTYIYSGGATTLQVYCGQYCPVVKVEKITTTFTLNLTQSEVVKPNLVEQISYSQHGAGFNSGHSDWDWYAAKFPVAGPTFVSIKGCQYGETDQGYIENSSGKLQDLNTKFSDCSTYAKYLYSGAADNLSVYCGHYAHELKVNKVCTDFEIDLSQKKIEQADLPDGITKISYPSNGADFSSDHGNTWFAVEFAVDGPVDITVGGCNYQGNYYAYVNDLSGTKLADITNDKCSETATYHYLGEAGVLRLYCGQYCPSIKVEKPAVQPRTFTDFKIDFRVKTSNDVPYTVISPSSGLPSGVELSNVSINGGQHGAQSATITVPVDGAVNFNFGSCSYGNHKITVKKNGVDLETITDNVTTCESTVESLPTEQYKKYYTWKYNSTEAATLTFTLNGYLPYFFAEACEYVNECTISYYNTDGELLGNETVEAGSDLSFNATYRSQVTIPAGHEFRGWYDSNAATAKKVVEGSKVNANLKLYAKTTAHESVSVGDVKYFDLRLSSFDFDNYDGIISHSGGRYNDGQHGWEFQNGHTLSLQVAGDATVTLSLCQYANAGTITVNDGNGSQIAQFSNTGGFDGSYRAFEYIGEATTLTLSFSAKTYIHTIKVDNTTPVEVPSSGPYNAVVGGTGNAATDAAQLKKALIMANGTSSNRYQIFIKNGTYDLDTDYDTYVNSYTTLIGESRDGVLITNHPATEGIWTSATLRTGSNVVMQNLSLWSQVTASSEGRRGTALYDDGVNNAYVNVLLKGFQDTYYSSEKTKSYFEKCEIHGAIDFICGAGAVWFELCDLRIESHSGGWIVAPKTDTKGYTFNNCTIDNASGANMNGKFYLGRGWEGNPKTVFAGSYDNYKIKPNGFESDGYDKSSWAAGSSYTAGDNSGMTKQPEVFTTDDAKTAVGDFVAKSTPLAAPENVIFKDGKLTWTAVANAACYYVYKNDVFEAKVTTNSYTPASSSSAKGIRKTAEAAGGYTVAAVADNGLIGTFADATSGGRTMKDFVLDFTSGGNAEGAKDADGNATLNNEGGAQKTVGITFNAEGKPIFSEITDGADIQFYGKLHGNTYGVCGNPTFTVPVDGPIKFTYGKTKYSGDVVVTDESGNLVARISTKDAADFSASTMTPVFVGYYSGGETTLTFTGGKYVPYFAIEKVDVTEALLSVNYIQGSENTGMQGSLPYTEFVHSNQDITLYSKRSVYREGYTLTGWTDGIENYALGATYNVKSAVSIKPVFRKNNYTLADRSTPLTITWNLGESTGAPSMSLQNQTGFVVAQATVEGEAIDVKMDINTASGKVDNAGRNDKWAQVNSGAKFTIPHYKGATVSLESNSATTTTTVDGVAATGNTNTVYSTEVAKDAETIDIVFGDGGYMSYIQTVLPIVEGSDQASVVLYSLTNSVGSAEVTADNATVTAGESLVMTDSNGRIKITPKTGEKFKNGDKITFSGKVGNTSKDYGIKVFAPNGTSSACEFKVAGTTDPLQVEGTLTLTADADYILIGRFGGTTTTLTSCEITGNRQKRTFKDFKIDFRTNPYTVVLPTIGTFPTGVKVNSTFHDGQHGYTGGTITVPVDGPVKFTIGKCGYSGKFTVTDSSGTVNEELDNGGSCDNSTSTNEYITWTYNSNTATTLTFNMPTYFPYFYAEACDYIPSVTVTYYNTDGTKLGEETVDGGSKLAYKYTVSDVTVGTDKAFRGWFDKATNGKKVAVGTAVNANLKLYAVATDIETATKGSTYTYDLTKDYFYQEDHECITMTCGSFHDGQHGWSFGNGGKIDIPVPGNSKITLGLCQFTGGGTTTVTSSNGGTISPASFDTNVTTDGTTQEITYTGSATTLKFTLGSGGYVHSIKVVNEALPASDLAIVSGKEIVELNPNGTYKLTKYTDYSTTFTETETDKITFTSSNTDIVTVATDGTITAGTKYGQTKVTVSHPQTNDVAAGSVEFTVKVIAAAGQTHKPEVTINADGTVTIVKSSEETASTFYYTLDGSDPSNEESTTRIQYNGVITNASGKVIKVCAVTTDKSPSDVVTAYVNVTGTFTWVWNTAGKVTLEPVVEGNVQDAIDDNTKAVYNSNYLTQSTINPNEADTPLAAFTPPSKKSVSAPTDNACISFNIIPVAGVSFKPTAVSYDVLRDGTSSGLMDVKLVSESQTYDLYTKQKPTLDHLDSFTPTLPSVNGAAEEWALKLYLYSLSESKNWGFRNIVISGTFSGVVYDGIFYNISASAEPNEGGTVSHSPSASKTVPGKNVIFKAVPNTGYKFVKWVDMDDNMDVSTDATYTKTSLNNDYVLEGLFEALPKITFVNNSESLTGTVPAVTYTNADHTFTIPQNTTLYREGWAVTGWKNGDEVYLIGSTQTFDADVTLTPVVTQCDKALTDVNAATSVIWPFDQTDGAPAINGDPISMTYVKCVSVGESKIDVPLKLSGAKMDNTDARVNRLDDGEDVSKPAKGGQLNNNSVINIPAVPGMIVKLKASGKIDLDYSNNVTNFTGETDATRASIAFYNTGTTTTATGEVTSTEQKLITYTYTGNEKTIDLKIINGGTNNQWGFFEFLEVIYPVLPDIEFANTITYAEGDVAFSTEKVVNAGSSTKTASTHPNTGKRYKENDVVTITATAGYGYKLIGFTSNKGTLGTATIADDGASGTVDYTVGAETGTVTAQYERLPMGKVRLESVDDKLGEVDFASGSKFENFYTKGTDYVESYFVVAGSATAIATAADDYVVDKWTSGSAAGSTESTANQCIITVTAEAQTFFAHFTHGKMGSVTFDIESPMIVKTVDGVSTFNAPDYTITDEDNPDYYGPTAYDETDNAVSQAPASVTNSYSFTVPKYSTVFKTGYTLKFWKEKNGERTYVLGTNSSFQTENESLTLVPVYEKNPTTQFNRLNEPIMTYEFGTGKGIRAQKVNLGKNTKTFWTAQVWVEAIDKSIRYPHYRDVGVWVQTGSKGFVRNGDLDEWASFGPGTKFYIASCAGTRIELLTYSPITTTTFGGEVFTLKEQISEHEYLYECTTQLADQRVPIEIGDDYSYYKYFKVYSKMADRVNLHINVDDNMHGDIKKVEAINTSADIQQPIIELEDGGHSFNQGNGVKVTFKRRFGFEFDKIIDPDKKDAQGKPLAVLQMNSDGSVNMVNLNNATTVEKVNQNKDDQGNYNDAWGKEDLSKSSHVFYLKKTELAMNSDSLRTQYEVSFNITTHRNLEVYFKEKPTYYVTYSPGQYATGIAPAAEWLELGDQFTIPNNNTLYYEGNTLKYWVDSEGTRYEIGQTYTLNHDWDTSDEGVDYNLRLFPVFEKNEFNILDDEVDGKTATWNFAKDLGAPVINFQRSSGILVTQLYTNDAKTRWIDIKADLDASDITIDGKVKYGKFLNDTYDPITGKPTNTNRCQINIYSVMTFPTTKNCEIELAALNSFAASADERTVIAGTTNYTVSKKANVTITGDEPTQDVEFKSDGKYYTYFSVKYKKQDVQKPVLTSVTYGSTTLTSEQLNDLKTNRTLTINVTVDPSTEIIPNVTGVASNNGKVTATKATVENPTSVITLKSANGTLVDTYTLNFTPKLPNDAPAIEFLGFEINGQHYDNGAEVTNLPVSGVIKLKFNRTMDTYTIKSGAGLNTQYTASAGKTLEFSYWSLPVNLMSTFQVPSELSPEKFKDIYGNEYSQTLSLRLKFSSTSMSIEHRTFDYIVSDGDLGKAIDAANAAEGTDRYYVFIPDGDYELKGNENVTIQNVTSDGTAPHDENGVSTKLGQTINNGMTAVSRANVSLIGQSMDGVVIHNHPEVEGIAYTATIHTGKNATDFYAEELSLRNDFDYWTCMNNGSNAARAVCFCDQGNRTILKNVSMKSWQDTYYSSNAIADYRAYWEDCTLGGIIDWACGDGNIWWERCDIQIRDRSGNNFAAPHTEPGQQWGYVFNNCRIMPEPNVTMEKLKGKDWTIARPWGSVDAVNPEKSQSPACTFLNTYFSILPKDAGWGSMGASMVLRFHEYNSMDGNGNKISLGARSLASANPAAGSDECILTDALKAQYTIENVLGGSDAFTPKSFTQQIDAASGAAADKDPNNSKVWNDNIETDDDLLKWNVEPMALCYFIFQKDNGKWKYITNVCQENDNDATMSFSLESLGSGMYCVRAANQRGGLGAATKVIEYVAADKIFVDVKEVEKDADNKSIGWATICLSFNAKLKYVVDEKKDTVLVSDNPVKIYSAVSISDNTITLKKVDYLSANVGYVIYGTPGIYGFASSSHDAYDTSGYTYNHDSYLGGNPTADPVTAQNGSYYTLAYKPNISGIGFYKYTGSDLNPYKAYLSASTFLDLNESNKDESDIKSQAERRGIIFKFEDNDVVDIPALTTGDQRSTDVIYDLMGRRVKSPEKGRIYIINGQKIVFK